MLLTSARAWRRLVWKQVARERCSVTRRPNSRRQQVVAAAERLEDRTLLSNVAVVDNNANVDTIDELDFLEAESGNQQASLATLGDTVTTFTGITTADLLESPAGEVPVADVGEDRSANEGDTLTFEVDGVETLTYTWDFGDGTFATGASVSHAWGDNGEYTVTLTVTDGIGGVATDMAIVTVANVAPTVAILGAPETAPEGSSLSFDSSVIDPGHLDTHTYAWTITKEGDLYDSHNVASPLFVLGDDGIYTVTLVVTDDDGGVGTATTTIVVENVPPIFTSPAPGFDAIFLDASVIDEGGTVKLTGIFFDPGYDSHQIIIDWGDGTTSAATPIAGPGLNGFVVTHQYLDDVASSLLTITATVVDDDSGVGAASTTVAVNNIAPEIVLLNAPASINEGSTAAITGSFTDVGLLDTHTVLVEWGDGTSSFAVVDAATRTFTASHAYLDDAPTGTSSDAYTVSVTVIDDDGGTATATAAVTVNNVAPVASITGGTAVRGVATSINGIVADPGLLDTVTALVSWGDGSASELLTVSLAGGVGTLTGTHTYATNGTYTVSVTITDDDGGVSSMTSTVKVQTATLLADPLGGGQALFVGGTTGADDIVILPQLFSSGVNVLVNGSLVGSYNPSSGRIVVHGQSGNDKVLVLTGHSAWIYGGAGDDWLIGGFGNDVLLGEAGDDLLVGSGGRDLLVGGDGNDILLGDFDDDILIAGSLNFGDAASEAAAIRSVMQEWTSRRTFQARVANLIGESATGSNGPTLLRAGETVLDDDSTDLLVGGIGLDWFLFDSDNDHVVDMTNLERLFAETDLDFITAS